MDLILRNGTVVTHAEEFIADIGIEGGKIKQIGQELGPAAVAAFLGRLQADRLRRRPQMEGVLGREHGSSQAARRADFFQVGPGCTDLFAIG